MKETDDWRRSEKGRRSRRKEVECAVLEGGAVGGEKSRTLLPLPWTEHLLYIPWLSTFEKGTFSSHLSRADSPPDNRLNAPAFRSPTIQRLYPASTSFFDVCP
ncbi:hypothetical protein QLX08_009840 [Tetragonisca angustula]|uniref:Uncharacterized protein n=1 Tax=Tetragonisca angustula TaxID=166442 RepID=A0AAW0ZEK5_9HYME